ncbi:hypothetical protein BH24ACT22_BH24ACT22_08360 [soil metagenome]
MGVISVIWSPVRTLREVAEDRRVLSGFLVVAAGAVLSLISSAIFIFTGLLQTQFEAFFEATEGQIPPELQENFVALTGVSSIVLAVLWPFVIWVSISLIMQLVTRFFGGEGPLSAMFAVVGVAYLPYVLSTLISTPIQALQATLDPTGAAASILGLLGGLLSLVFLAWFVVLVVIGAALARNIGYGESTGSCAISCAGCLGLIIGMVIILGIVVSVFAGAAGSQ